MNNNMSAQEFLKSKIGEYNSYHPVTQIDYDDLEKWLDEYAAVKLKEWREKNEPKTGDPRYNSDSDYDQ